MREKRIRRRAAVLAVSTSLLAIAALPAIPAGAGAATTIGSNLAAAPTVDLHCLIPHGCTLGQRVLPPTSQAPGGVFAPHDGVVVRWRIKVGIVGIQTVEPALVITRPGSSDTRAGVGTGPQVITPTDQTSTYDVRIPIQAGDALALFCCTTNDAFGPGQYVQAASPGAVSVLWRPEDLLGSGRAGYQLQDQELLINADIEPDCDGDGLGDESQDTSTSPCPTCKGQPATIIGTSGDDVRIGTPGRDVMVGLAGNDTLSGFEGDDRICGGAGNDTMYGGPGNDILLGQKGRDKLYGEAGKDTLQGGSGKDKLKGGGGADVCKGGKDNDTASKCKVAKSI